MQESAPPAGAKKPRRRGVHWWVRRGFLLWAVVSTSWFANSVRTQGVDDDLVRDGDAVLVHDGVATLEFEPTVPDNRAGLVFICGSGIAAQAYAPLLWPVAEAGYAVVVVKLPYRFAPLASHKQEAVARAFAAMAAHPEVGRWVVAGHSLGGALAARVARSEPAALSALVLVGTTHPREDDLSFLRLPVTKIYASNDGVAPPERVLANARLLPEHTRWVEIEGGNHSQFGHYGHQFLDGTATISREVQQNATRAALFEVLAAASEESTARSAPERR